MKRKHKAKKDKLNVIINLRVTKDMFKKLDRMAGEKEQTMSEFIRAMLEDVG